MILRSEAGWWTNIVFWTELRVGRQRPGGHGVGRVLGRTGERRWGHWERPDTGYYIDAVVTCVRKYLTISLLSLITQHQHNILLLLRKPGRGVEESDLDLMLTESEAARLKMGLLGWTGVQNLVTLESSNPSSKYSDPEVRLVGGLILGRTCWNALDPEELELCFRTSSWSLISWTRSWMLLKADFGRELLLFFTAEGNL